MAPLKPTDCPKHAGRHNKDNRHSLERVMVGLPKNQSGKGRAKCQYCAYQRGFEQGYAEALEDLSDCVRVMQSNHRCRTSSN